MRWTATFLLALVAVVAQAQAAGSGNITYTRPAVYADGVTPLPASAITGYEFRCTGVVGTTAGVSCALLTLPGSALAGVSVVTVPLSGGTACWVGRTIIGAAPGQIFSADSNVACKTFPAVPPSPPGSVVVAQVQTIEVGIAVAYLETALGARASAVAGFVPLGTPCVGAVRFAYRGQSYRRVDQTKVIWWQTTPSAKVAAPCA